MGERSYDVVLYGATGFTGRQLATWMATHAPDGLRWAIAGRNERRLQELREQLDLPDVGVVVADANDADAVDQLAASTRVVASTAGPFALYSDPVVDACVRQGTDYVDITGETPWVRELIDRHHETAQERGIRLVPLCGFDSVPSDIGTLFAVQQIRQTWDQGCSSVRGCFSWKGGVNGGTLASTVHMAESGSARALADPVLLNPKPDRTPEARERGRDPREAWFDPDLRCWTAPFVMGPVNSRVVRRSASLRRAWGEPYGPDFQYVERQRAGSAWGALGIAAGLGLFATTVRFEVGRKLLARFGPDPGEGPTETTMDNGWFEVRFIGEAEDGRRMLCRLRDTGDPGNRVTVRILGLATLQLALHRDELPGGPERGGVLTPATAFGERLLDAWQGAGAQFSAEPLES